MASMCFFKYMISVSCVGLWAFSIIENSIAEEAVSSNNGTFARFADQALTGVKIPSGTSDTLICDQALLQAAKEAGLGSGERCIRFSNNDATGVNYIPLKPSGFVSFLEYFRNHPLRDACEVDPNPWMGWSGEAPQACGITAFEQSNTCIERSFVCGDTCPYSPNGDFMIYRNSPVEGYCCDPDSYSSQTGLTEAQTAASCTFPNTIAFEEISECGVPRTTQLTCGACGTHEWSPMDGIASEVLAQQCTEGNVTSIFLINGCGAIKTEQVPCTGCKETDWTVPGFLTLEEAANSCVVGDTVSAGNGCGDILDLDCTG